MKRQISPIREKCNTIRNTTNTHKLTVKSDLFLGILFEFTFNIKIAPICEVLI